MSLPLSAAVFLLTLALIFLRPRGMNEATAACIGAMAMLALRLVTPGDFAHILAETANVLLFLLGMMLVTGVVEHAGVFDALAVRAARLSRGDGRLLLLNVFLLGTLVTAFLSLDVTIIVVTPIVYALTERLGIEPLPYLFACAFVANTASLFLPISNLTNILIYDLLHLSFVQFATVMFLPNLAALAVNIGIFFAIFCHQLPLRFATTALTDGAPPPGFAIAAVSLAVVLVALLAFGLLALPLAIPACVGAVALATAAMTRRIVTGRALAGSVSWSLFPFVIAMFTVMRGLERAWLPHLHTIPSGQGLGTLLVIAFGTGIGANVVNNVPMIAAMITLLRAVAVPVPEHLAFATLIGTNIGPSVLTFGSLATMLWLALMRKRGVDVSARAYLRIGLITTPPMLLAATVTLWLVLGGLS
jgi:arsenical pump membrane protein